MTPRPAILDYRLRNLCPAGGQALYNQLDADNDALLEAMKAAEGDADKILDLVIQALDNVRMQYVLLGLPVDMAWPTLDRLLEERKQAK